jgi:succinate dehydrogenase / fumarate reductase cytochrome b subunit
MGFHHRNTMDNTNRPCSPHLQIYKLPLTARLSISHRLTGALLTLGLAFFTAGLMQISAGPESFSALQRLLVYTPVQIALGLFVYALFFHWCHGIRHLIMDTGKSLDKYTMTRYALLEIALSLLLTAAAAVFIWAG